MITMTATMTTMITTTNSRKAHNPLEINFSGGFFFVWTSSLLDKQTSSERGHRVYSINKPRQSEDIEQARWTNRDSV